MSAKKLLIAIATSISALLLISCASKRAAEDATATPVTVIGFEVTKGVGLREDTVKSFAAALQNSLSKAGFAPTVVDSEAQIPKAGIAMKGKIVDLPSSTQSRGRVSLLCNFYVDGAEVKSGSYSQEVTSTENNLTPDQRDISRTPQREAINMALYDLLKDLRYCANKAGKP